MAYAEEGGADAKDTTMEESTTPTTTAMPALSATGTETAEATGIEPGNRLGVAAPNV